MSICSLCLEATGLGKKQRCPQTARNKGNLKLSKKLSRQQLSWKSCSKVSRERQFLYQRCKASFKACVNNHIFLIHHKCSKLILVVHVCSRVYNKIERIVSKHYSKDITHFRKCWSQFLPFPPGLRKFAEAIPNTREVVANFFPQHNARVKHKNKGDITWRSICSALWRAAFWQQWKFEENYFISNMDMSNRWQNVLRLI